MQLLHDEAHRVGYSFELAANQGDAVLSAGEHVRRLANFDPRTRLALQLVDGSATLADDGAGRIVRNEEFDRRSGRVFSGRGECKGRVMAIVVTKVEKKYVMGVSWSCVRAMEV